MRNIAAFLLLFGVAFANASDLSSLSYDAVERSQLTLPGSVPFHLKAITYEATNSKNDAYMAEIEMWWASPTRWKRVIRSKSFSSTYIVDGDAHSGEYTGNFQPMWLQTFVDALFDQAKQLHGVQLSKSNDNPVIGGDEICRRFDTHVGIPPVHNRIFWSYCFRNGLISNIGTPWFHAEYLDYKRFGNKQVARRLEQYISPGETAGAKIVELNEWTVDPSFFAMAKATPDFPVIPIDEAHLREMGPAQQNIEWPRGKGGKPAGTLTILIAIDTEGVVREVRELNSDNPNMTEAAVEQVKAWRFKHANYQGKPAQVEGLLTFAYDVSSSQAATIPGNEIR